MSHSLNSLKGGYIGDYIGDDNITIIKGDTRSLDSSSHGNSRSFQCVCIWIFKMFPGSWVTFCAFSLTLWEVSWALGFTISGLGFDFLNCCGWGVRRPPTLACSPCRTGSLGFHASACGRACSYTLSPKAQVLHTLHVPTLDR